MKKWMKKLTGGILCAVIGLSAFSSQEVYAAEKEQMRAVWISTVYSADYPSSINDPSGQAGCSAGDGVEYGGGAGASKGRCFL